MSLPWPRTGLLSPGLGAWVPRPLPSHPKTNDPGPKHKARPKGRLELLLLRGGHRRVPAHGHVSVLPGISTCHQLKVSGTCKAHSEGGGRGRSHQGPGAGWTERESVTGQEFMSALMGQPVSLGHQGARAPWEREVGSSTQRGVPQA